MRLSLSRWWLCALAMCLNFSALSADTIVVQNKQGEIKKFSPVSTEKKEQMKKEQKEQTLNLRVVEMTSKIFASTGDGNVWLIEFYTPW